MPLYNEPHMRTLIIQLPPGLPSPNLAYAHAQVMAVVVPATAAAASG